MPQRDLVARVDDLPLETFFVGPSIDAGCAPAVFYFSLTAADSLYQQPIAQPTELWYQKGFRTFSFDLPFHGASTPHATALEQWGRDFATIKEFIERASQTIRQLEARGLVNLEQSALVGISRGAYLAAHLAARTQIKHLIGFAPLTELSKHPAFTSCCDPDLESFDLSNRIPELWEKSIRFYISNRDTLVGTKRAFDLITQLADYAFNSGVRTSSHTLELYPAIGREGHGTSGEVFDRGARQVINMLHGESS